MVNTSIEARPPRESVEGLTVHYFPIEDFESPSTEQFIEFLTLTDSIAQKGEALAVHCRGGNGRTGTFLVAWYMWNRGVNFEEALKMVRSVRPWAVESSEQKKGLLELEKVLKQSTQRVL